MTVQELQERLRARHPEALLVPGRLLRRVLRSDRQVATRRLPHAFLHEVTRDTLLVHVTLEELGLLSGQELPEWVLLLPAPEGPITPAVLFDYSRLLFHGAAHRRFRQLNLEGEVLQQRIAELGEVEFAEARDVLRQENRLFSSNDDREVYEEFATWFLELRQFAPEQVGIVFPACRDVERIERLFQADLDAPALFRESWLEGASRPVEELFAPEPPTTEDDTTVEPTGKLKAAADEANRVGNMIRAVLLQHRARTGSTRKLHHRTQALLGIFAVRLTQALGLPSEEAPTWQSALETLVGPAARGYWNTEARLLYDLQKVCVDLEKPLFAADLVEWLVTLGRRPIKRPLPDLPLVLAVKHLRRAQQRLWVARLEPAAREKWSELLRAAEHHLEGRLRQTLRPKIHEALDQAGLVPHNQAERLSRDRLVEELLDRIGAIGALTLGDLRDAVARNRVKLPDLAGPGELLRGDALLRANEHLALSLDGIARRGEGYLRWLQTFSSLFFGTLQGRRLTLYILLPLLVSLFTLKGLDALISEVLHVAHWVAHLNDSPDLPSNTFDGEDGDETRPPTEPEPTPKVKKAKGDIVFHWLYTFLPLAGFYGLLFHVARVRRVVGQVLWYTLWIPLRWLFYDSLHTLLSYEPLQRFLASRSFQVFMRVVGRPALATLLLLGFLYLLAYLRLFHLRGRDLWIVLGVWFIGVSIFLNTSWGRAFEEQLAEVLGRAWELFHRDFLLGIWSFFTWVFRALGDRLDQWLYAVDERLRFREGETGGAFVRKVILGFFWFGLVYLVRMVVILLVEPQINPIKHFPVVTVCHKLSLLAVMPLSNLTGIHPGYVGVVLSLIPGVFGFLAWELKENWRLYKANDSATLDPEMIGSHGEHIIHYIRPGFHSGTLPALFASYRRNPTGKAARRCAEGLHHVEEEIQRFVERELIAPLALSNAWPANERPRLGEIALATNRIRVELLGPIDQESAEWEWVNHEGRLLLRWVRLGWLARLTAAQRNALEVVLASFWSRSGVERIGADANEGVPRLAWASWVQQCESGLSQTVGLEGRRRGFVG
jgi:hypothetical protein